MAALLGPPQDVHVSDDAFIAVPPAVVAAVVADPARWSRWWPGLTLQTSRDRGVKGRQWVVSGPLRGTAEIWLEPWRDGTIVHLFLRLEPAGAGRAPRRVAREREERQLWWKRQVYALKDELEAGRVPGSPGVPG